MTPLAGSGSGGTRLLRFLTVGATNAAVSLGVFLGLVAWGGMPGGAAAAQVVAWSVGVAWSWSWNRRWTFAARGGRGTLRAFAALQAGLAGATAAALGLLVDGLGAPPAPAWLMVAVLATATNFVLSDRWVFRRDARA